MVHQISRRHFLGGLALCGTAAATGVAALRDDTENLEVVRVKVPLGHLPVEFHGYRLAVLTDLHLGIWVRDDLIDQALSEVLAFRPDLILLGGDYIWVPEQKSFASEGFVRNAALAGLRGPQAADAAFARVAKLLGRLPPTTPALAVVGNHDRWIDQNACRTHLSSVAGLRLLVNDSWQTRRGNSELSVWGTDDYLTGAPRLPERQRTTGHLHILLTHNPDLAARAIMRSTYSYDLAICGHTHGGQIQLPLLGALTYHLENPDLGEGLVWRGEQAVYVSRGIGVVEVPFRVLCRPEVSLLTLV